MSIIQTIRDKGAKVSVVLIALALVGFILTDYFQGQSRGMRGGTSSSVGSVNGRSVNYEDFNLKVDQMQENMKAQGYPQTPALFQQAFDQTWNEEVKSLLLLDETSKLGIDVGKKELGDILYGPNAPEDLKKQFTDPATGQFNAVLAKQNIDQMLKKGTPEQKTSFNNYIKMLEEQRKSDKYISLLTNSINYPRWFIEKQNADNSQIAKISFVKEAYTAIADSAIKIEDKEIAAYISKHKDDFKQQESRSISFLTFSAAPSSADSAETIKSLLELKAEFDTTANTELFLLSQGVNNYYKGFISGKTIQIAVKDSIFRTPVGSIYGPYLDGASYVMAKLEGVKQTPDTVKVRHILISTESRDTATAYKLTDSIRTAIAKGSGFDSLCVKFSDDPGSKDKGGVYENVPSGQMVPPFNDFIFQNPTGSKGIVKTDFGYHYIEVLSQKGSSPSYKIAYLPKEISPSQATDDAANENANKFAGDIKDIKTFDAVYEKEWKAKGYQKNIATDITRTNGEIRGLGISRQLVRSIYDARVGEVIKPERVNDNYVVAVVTEAYEEGTASVTRARPMVEPLLRNKKKAEMLKQKVGKISTLEAAATALGGKTIEIADSLRMNGASANTGLSYEPKITGAAFNPAKKGKIVPEVLEGVNGVYVVRVDSTGTTSVPVSIAEQRIQMTQQAKQYFSNPQSPAYPLNTLRSAATIKDKRGNRY